MSDTWPQMDKGRPLPGGSWKQPPGSGGGPARVPRPGDPSVVDASLLPTPTAPQPPVEALPPRACLECGGKVDADGYCEQCGAKAPSERDHFEESPASWVGAVCDRGVRHARNEDGMATAASEQDAGAKAALVVCDGVTTSDDSDAAALAAARAARDLLDEGQPQKMGTPASRDAAAAALLTRAAAVANDAVAANTKPGAQNPAACTFVAALIVDKMVYAGNVGDSRVYWFGDDGSANMLSSDDSLAAEDIASGKPRKEAEEAAGAHTITRWLGIDALDVAPHTSAMAIPGPGWVLVCSDGLWNYASEPADLLGVLRGALAELSAAGGPAVAPVDAARALVKWAIAQGGHDNISACLARVGVVAPAAASEPSATADEEIPTSKVLPAKPEPAVSPPAAAQPAPAASGYDPITHEPMIDSASRERDPEEG